MAKKNIVNKVVSLIPGEFNLSTMTTEKPLDNKDQILKYLKSVDAFTATTYPYEDPIDGSLLTCENASFTDKEFIWSNVAVIMFEKYNILLDDRFVNLFVSE